MADDRLLLVEGDDDKHVFYAILKHRNFTPVIPIESQVSVDQLLRGLQARLLPGDPVSRLGFVVDADADLATRWQEVRRILLKAGRGGGRRRSRRLTGTIVAATDLPTVGVWVMPDNILRGTLEDFLTLLVPDGDVLWEQAKKCVDEAVAIEKRFKGQYDNKALIHTYLAWQKDPGLPMGRAITMRCFQPESQHADKFVAWLSRLFS